MKYIICPSCSYGWHEDENGNHVPHTDDAAIKAERDALRKRVRDLEEDIAEWTQAGHAGWWAKKCGKAEAERDALKAAILARCASECEVYRPYKRHAPNCLAADLGLIVEEV